MVRLIASILFVAMSTAASAEVLLPSVVLQVPGNPRSLGMGLTGTADDADPANSWHNPANLNLQGLWFGGAFANWPGDRNRFDFGAAGGSLQRGPGGRWSFAATLRHARADLREFTGTNNVKLATHESWMTLAGSAGYGGEQLRLAAGGAFRWSTNEGDNETTGDAGVNVGGRFALSRRVSFRYGAGWSVRNIGMEGILDPDPSPPTTESIEEQWAGGLIRLAFTSPGGSSTPVELGISADARTDGDGSGAGAEITVMETIDLRAGYRDTFAAGVHARTLGAGVHRWFGFFFARIDYAYMEPVGGGSTAHTFGSLFGFDFGRENRAGRSR